MVKRRSTALIALIAVLSVLRYLLLLDTAVHLQVDAGRIALIGVMTVALWLLNGVGLVVLWNAVKRRVLGQ